jgi:ribosomal protein L32E
MSTIQATVNFNNNYSILMVISTPLLRKRIVKKRTLKFTRFQSDLYGGRLAESWRRPRGMTHLIQASTTE